jgi:integrase/recombinase XerD
LTISEPGRPGTRRPITTFAPYPSFYEYLAFEKKSAANPVIQIRKRCLKSYRDNHDGRERKPISVEEMGRMINSEMNIRDKAIITLLAKTGIRRNELISLEVSDVDLVEQKIRLKPTTSKPTERYSLTMRRPSSSGDGFQ